MAIESLPTTPVNTPRARTKSPQGKPQCGPGRLVVAASFNFAKIFVADLADGSISVVDAAGALVPAAVPAAPPAAPPAVAAGEVHQVLY